MREYRCTRLMSRQSPTPKQLLTLRQVIIVFTIIILAYFAVRYSQNVLKYRALQEELATMEGHIVAAEQEKEQVNREFDESLSPAVVEEFARRELNWVRPGDEVVITVEGGAAPAEHRATVATSTEDESVTETKPNWRLWLELLSGES